MLVRRYVYFNGSAAMQAAKRSASVALEMNLRIPMPACDEVCSSPQKQWFPRIIFSHEWTSNFDTNLVLLVCHRLLILFFPTDPKRQCAAVSAQPGSTSTAPQVCLHSLLSSLKYCRDSCHGQASTSASLPPTMKKFVELSHGIWSGFCPQSSEENDLKKKKLT